MFGLKMPIQAPFWGENEENGNFLHFYFSTNEKLKMDNRMNQTA